MMLHASARREKKMEAAETGAQCGSGSWGESIFFSGGQLTGWYIMTFFLNAEGSELDESLGCTSVRFPYLPPPHALNTIYTAASTSKSREVCSKMT